MVVVLERLSVAAAVAVEVAVACSWMRKISSNLEEVDPAGLLVVESIGTIGLLRLMRLLLVNGPRLLLLLLFLSLSPSWVMVVFGWGPDEDVFCDCGIRNER